MSSYTESFCHLFSILTTTLLVQPSETWTNEIAFSMVAALIFSFSIFFILPLRLYVWSTNVTSSLHLKYFVDFILPAVSAVAHRVSPISLSSLISHHFLHSTVCFLSVPRSLTLPLIILFPPPRISFSPLLQQTCSSSFKSRLK